MALDLAQSPWVHCPWDAFRWGWAMSPARIHARTCPDPLPGGPGWKQFMLLLNQPATCPARCYITWLVGALGGVRLPRTGSCPHIARPLSACAWSPYFLVRHLPLGCLTLGPPQMLSFRVLCNFSLWLNDGPSCVATRVLAAREGHTEPARPLQSVLREQQ